MHKEIKKDERKDGSIKKIFKILLNIFSIALIFYCLLATILIWLLDKQIISSVINITKTSPAFVIIMPKMLIELLFLIIPLTIFQLFDIVIWFWFIGIILFIILGLTCFSFIKTIIKNKKENKLTFINFPWIKLTLAVWLMSILFFGSTGTPSLRWSQPVIKVSRNIEVTQFGPIYNFVKYTNRDDGFFKYSININIDNKFSVQQIKNSNKISLYNIINGSKLKKNNNSTAIAEYSGDETLPADIKCYANNNTQNNYIYLKNRCNELWYKEKLIFKTKEWPVWVKRVEINNDNTKLLIHIYPGYVTPESVFLVTL
ncbi:MAG: hypothetical protein WC752_03520 [Patescibacteria group bacterium]|jgi:hypothetical protein